jgi:hypothetical protein
MRRVPGSRHYRGYMPAYASPGKRRLSLQAVLITWPLIAPTGHSLEDRLGAH